MRFENERRIIKNIFLIAIFSINFFTVFLATTLLFNGVEIKYILISLFYFSVDFYMLSIYLGKLGYCIIDENGIYRKTLFFEKQYRWSEISFISKAEFMKSHNYMLFSVNEPREKLSKKLMFVGISKRYFMLPYSEELESCVIINSPESCYTYDYIFKRDF